MLPTFGYFKGIECPFAEGGTCRRVYCHLRHAIRKDRSSAVTDAPNSDPESGGNVTRQQNERDEEPVKERVTVVYNPTPITLLNKMKAEKEIEVPIAFAHSERVLKVDCCCSPISPSGEGDRCGYHFGPIEGAPAVEDEGLPDKTRKDGGPAGGVAGVPAKVAAKRHDRKNARVADRGSAVEDQKTKIEPQQGNKTLTEGPPLKETKSRNKNKTKEEKKADKVRDNKTERCKERNKEEKRRNENNMNKTTTPKRIIQEFDIFSFPHDNNNEDPEEIVLEECKKIFKEYEPSSKIPDKTTTNAKLSKLTDFDTYLAGKKRIAHENASKVSKYQNNTNNSEKKNNKVIITPANKTMMNRYKVIQQQENNSFSYRPPNKLRKITILDAKKKDEMLSKKTPVQTIAKGSKRLAHIPERILQEIPVVLNSDNSRFPLNVRARFLHLLVKETSKLYAFKESIYERALNEELNCYKRCSAVSTYRNSAMLAVNRLRKEAESGNISAMTVADKKRSSIASELEGERLYSNLSKYLLVPKELDMHGYPRPSKLSGRAVFKDDKKYETLPVNTHRCSRCSKLFQTSGGAPIFEEECIYHPCKKYMFRGEAKRICCGETTDSTGCCSAPHHVFEVGNPDELKGFVKTLEPTGPADERSRQVYAIDCEMIYTTRGMELARVSVVNCRAENVYEAIVKPFGAVLDYNTRFSGLTEDVMSGATANLLDVQAALLHLINSKTILVGHSLESDLKSLRIIHENVADTSVLFPHKMGLPKKRSLKNLASEYLRKLIQMNENGHDSAEDAIATMELVLWKLKEDLKINKFVIVNN